MEAIELDGTTLEGGGQLIRIALGLSALCKIPLKINNIRGKRPGGGGLKLQHITSIRWLSDATNASVAGATPKSRFLEFIPSTANGEDISTVYKEIRQPNGMTYLSSQITQTTPGAVALVLQAILPYLLFGGTAQPSESSSPCPITLTIQGGTNVSFSPSIDYLTNVLFPTFHRLGLPKITATLHSRGWSSSSHQHLGSVTFNIPPLPRGRHVPAIRLPNSRGPVTRLIAIVVAYPALQSAIREWLSSLVDLIIRPLLPSNPPVSIEMNFEASTKPQLCYVLLVAITADGWRLGRDRLMEGKGLRRGKKKAEDGDDSGIIRALLKSAVEDLATELRHHGPLDEYARDQVVIYQALAGKGGEKVGKDGAEEVSIGNCGVKPSLHVQTAEWVVSKLLGVEIDENGVKEGVSFRAGEMFNARNAD